MHRSRFVSHVEILHSVHLSEFKQSASKIIWQFALQLQSASVILVCEIFPAQRRDICVVHGYLAQQRIFASSQGICNVKLHLKAYF